VVEFSDQAFADLQAIERWIAKDNPRVAREKAVMLAATCELLDCKSAPKWDPIQT